MTITIANLIPTYQKASFKLPPSSCAPPRAGGPETDKKPGDLVQSATFQLDFRPLNPKP